MSQTTVASTVKTTQTTAMTVLLGVSAAHLLNDAMQSVVPAVFPLFQQNLQLSFTEVGWIAFTLNITASIYSL